MLSAAIERIREDFPGLNSMLYIMGKSAQEAEVGSPPPVLGRLRLPD